LDRDLDNNNETNIADFQPNASGDVEETNRGMVLDEDF
jgi:hypothetical protein